MVDLIALYHFRTLHFFILHFVTAILLFTVTACLSQKSLHYNFLKYVCVCCYAVLRNKNNKHAMLSEICKRKQIPYCVKQNKTASGFYLVNESMSFSLQTPGGSSLETMVSGL